MTVLAILVLLGLATRASAEPHPGPAPAGKAELDRLVAAVNECRHQIGQPPIHPAARKWRGDRWDKQRLAIWRDRLAQCRQLLAGARANPRIAINLIFGPYRNQALAVSRCESGYSVNAQNGQYLGIFQMGSSERARYGHGHDALEQAIAAHRYFVASGRDWSPWSCKP